MIQFSNLARQSVIAKVFAEGNPHFFCVSANYCRGKIALTTFTQIFA